ncbi:MAG TPA: YbgA family protein [Nitrosopumilaceae archaeon]|nr:YbgA family protein [Nitrosopumilaceae archaeon]
MSIKKPQRQNNSSFSKHMEEDEILDFVLERFKELKLNPSMKNLVHFHTINKFLIMVHSPKHLNVLGNLIANHDQKELDDILENYEKQLKFALEISPTISSNINALSHIFSHFLHELSPDEKSAFLISLNHFCEGKITLSEMLGLLKSWTSKYDKTYLASQTYFLLYYEYPEQASFIGMNEGV